MKVSYEKIIYYQSLSNKFLTDVQLLESTIWPVTGKNQSIISNRVDG